MLEQQLREKTTAIPLQIAEAAGGDDMDRAAFGRVIEAAHVVADEGRIGLQRWIDAGRRAGMSWTDVGEVLGVSKQAAQQRFGGAAAADEPALGHAEVRLGVTAFNEVRILEAEGRKGHELMRVGGFFLSFRPTDHVWEHRRVIGLNSGVAEAGLASEGWIYVASWFPFHYFKRPLAGQPAAR